MPENIILGDMYARFEESALLEENTKAKCKAAINKLAMYKGHVEADTVTPQDIGAWQSWLKDMGLAVASIRGYFGAASQVYSWAVGQRMVEENPFAAAQKIRKLRPMVKVMDEQEIKDLSDAAAELDQSDPSARLRWVFMLELASTSGLRVGEIWNLRWEDIDLDQENIMIQFRPDCPGQYWRWGTKGKNERVVPIFQGALEAAYRLKDMAPWRYPALPQITCKRLQHLVGQLTEKQRKSPYNNFYRQLGEIKAYANGKRAFEKKPPIKNGGMHALRHTAISNWFGAGVSVPDAQYLAGHASELTTLRVYAHTTKEQALASVRSKMKQ